MLLFNERVHVQRRNLVQELDILVGVELGHLPLGGGFSTLRDWLACIHLEDGKGHAHKDLHTLVETVVHHKRMTHAYTRGLHPGWLFSARQFMEL